MDVEKDYLDFTDSDEDSGFFDFNPPELHENRAVYIQDAIPEDEEDLDQEDFVNTLENGAYAAEYDGTYCPEDDEDSESRISEMEKVLAEAAESLREAESIPAGTDEPQENNPQTSLLLISRDALIALRREKYEDTFTRLSTYKQLVTAVGTRKVIKGECAGVSIAKNPRTGENEPTAEIVINRCAKIYIPYSDFYYFDPSDDNSKGYELERKESILSGMIGSAVFFCLKSLSANPGEKYMTGIGSRVEAMKKMAMRYYNPKKPIVQVGSTIKCIVEVVGKHTVVVGAYGVDIAVRQRYLSYRYIEMCSDWYRQGDELLLTVIGITYDKDGFPDVALNGRVLEREKAKEDNGILADNTVCTCVISNKYTDPNNPLSVQYTGWIEKFELPVAVGNFDLRRVGYTLQVGDAFRIRTKKHLNNGLIAATVLRSLGSVNYHKKLRP